MRLIDADALPRLKITINNEWHMHEEVEVVYADDIDNAPTIDPVRHGEWIATEDPWFSACSVCGYLEYECVENNYCPECGAKMEEHGV